MIKFSSVLQNCPKHTQLKSKTISTKQSRFCKYNCFQARKRPLILMASHFSNLFVNGFPPLHILVKTTFSAFIFFYYSCNHQILTLNYRNSKHFLWFFDFCLRHPMGINFAQFVFLRNVASLWHCTINPISISATWFGTFVMGFFSI